MPVSGKMYIMQSVSLTVHSKEKSTFDSVSFCLSFCHVPSFNEEQEKGRSQEKERDRDREKEGETSAICTF